jgi:hypothetical protein
VSRDDRQRAVIEWVSATFGPRALAPHKRAQRVLEEAVELAQAEGMTGDLVIAVVQHVYGKSAGDPAKEAGDLGLTLLAYCAARGLSAEDEEVATFSRVQAIDPAYFRARHGLKVAAGIAVALQGPETSKDPETPVRDTGCSHPNSDVIRFDRHPSVRISWCSLCGSIRDEWGDHGAAASWRAPGGIVLPGWTCSVCGVLNGLLKELLPACRSCGTPREVGDPR